MREWTFCGRIGCIAPQSSLFVCPCGKVGGSSARQKLTTPKKKKQGVSCTASGKSKQGLNSCPPAMRLSTSPHGLASLARRPNASGNRTILKSIAARHTLLSSFPQFETSSRQPGALVWALPDPPAPTSTYRLQSFIAFETFVCGSTRQDMSFILLPLV